jgi:hypothetical protein
VTAQDDELHARLLRLRAERDEIAIRKAELQGAIGALDDYIASQPPA